MGNTEKLIAKKHQLKKRYKSLIEDAYNLRELDDALSDIAEFQATKVLNEINKLKFVVTDTFAVA